MAQKGLSIIICCYNSASRLPNTLNHLALQFVPGSVSWEVILVDNNSTDNTATLVKDLWNQFNSPVPLTVVKEEKPGLSHARHKGFITAQYEYCLFCDDDNWLATDYLATAYEIMGSDEKIGVLGGQGEAVCEAEPPSWFYDNQGSYAVGPQAEQEGDVSQNRGYVYGAAAVYRRSVYQLLLQNGYTGFLTGRRGGKVTAGDDSELCYNYVIKGYKIYYSTKLRFKHFIPSHRLTIQYYAKMKKGFQRAWVSLHLYEYKIRNINIHKRFLWLRDLYFVVKKEDKKLLFFHFRDTLTYSFLSEVIAYHKTLEYLRSHQICNLR